MNEQNQYSLGTYLDVPFRDKDEAKELGARWDGQMKRWYVPPGVTLEGFEKWMTGDAEEE